MMFKNYRTLTKKGGFARAQARTMLKWWIYNHLWLMMTFPMWATLGIIRGICEGLTWVLVHVAHWTYMPAWWFKPYNKFQQEHEKGYWLLGEDEDDE